jgi:allene oxide cyclase
MLNPRSRTMAAAIAAAVVPAAALPAAAVARAHSHAATRTVHVVEHANTDTEIPVAAGGKDEKGDPLTFINPVFNSADAKQVGHDEGFCTRLDPKLGTWECLWTTFLPGGQITVQGPFYDTRDSTLSITGGTGAYRTARGQMQLHALDGGKKYDFVFQIS